MLLFEYAAGCKGKYGQLHISSPFRRPSSFYPDPEIARATDPSESRDAVLYEALHFRVVTRAGAVTCGRG